MRMRLPKVIQKKYIFLYRLLLLLVISYEVSSSWRGSIFFVRLRGLIFVCRDLDF